MFEARLSTERGLELGRVSVNDAAAAARELSRAMGGQAQAIVQGEDGGYLVQPLVQLSSEFDATPGGRPITVPLRSPHLQPWFEELAIVRSMDADLVGIVLGDRFTSVRGR